MTELYILNDTPAVRNLNLNPGDIMERCDKYDYGLTRDDEAVTGEEHIFLSYDGYYPGYSLPLSSVSLYKRF